MTSQRVKSTELTGKVLGPYQVLDLIGVGGTAQVYRAFHSGLSREVALKVLFDGEDDLEGVARFRREMKLLTTLDHTGVLPILDSDHHNGVRYYVMPLVTAPTLQALLASTRSRGGRLSQENAVLLISNILEVLEQVHGQQVVHRDLKPANIFVKADYSAIVSDFGAARVVRGTTIITDTGHVIGTPIYMSPEQMVGQTVDCRSDIYSLGLVFYEAICGRLPFPNHLVDLVRMKMEPSEIPSPRAFFPEIAGEIEAIIRKACMREPARRFASAKLFRKALLAVPRSALRPRGLGPFPRSVPRLQASKGASLVGAAVLMVLAIAGGFLIRGPRSGAPIGTVAFPAPWTLELRLSDAASSVSEVHLMDGDRRIGVRTVQSQHIRFDGVPPGRRLSIVARGGAPMVTVGVLPVEVPAAVTLPTLSELPTAGGILVDFDFPCHRPARIEIRAKGRAEPVIAVRAAPDGHFHRYLEPLQAGHRYWLSIGFEGAWGGVEHLAFRTPGQEEALLASAAVASAVRDGHPVDVSSVLKTAAAPRGLRVIRNALTHPGAANAQWLPSVGLAAGRLRDPALAEALYRLTDQVRDEGVQAIILDALKSSRHSRAAKLARSLGSKSLYKPLQMARFGALLHAHDSGTRQQVAGILEGSNLEDGMPGLTLLTRAEPEWSRSLFLRWLRQKTPKSNLASLGIEGLTQLGEQRDAQAICSWLSENITDRTCGGLEALVLIGGPVSRACVRELLLEKPRNERLMWAAARLEIAGFGSIVHDQVTNERGNRRRRSAVSALGILGTQAQVAALERLLTDPIPEVAEAACWALTQLHATGSYARISGFARSEGDLRGMGARALAHLGASGSAPELRAYLKTHMKSAGALARTRLASIAWSLGRLGDARAAAELDLLQGAYPGDEVVGPAVQSALTALRRPTPESNRREYFLSPVAPFERTGVRLHPGESVEIDASGVWGFEGSGQGSVEVAREDPESATRLDLHATVGRKSLKLMKNPQRLVAEDDAEILLCPFGPTTLGERGQKYSPVTGWARVVIQR